MDTLTKTVLALALGVVTAAHAQQVIVIEGQREIIDPSALIGEDSGSFYLSRQAAATPRWSAAPTDSRGSAMTAALVSEDSGSAYFASLPLGPGVDREVVVAELDQARASGQLAALVSEDSGSAWLARSRIGMATAAIGRGEQRSRDQRDPVVAASEASAR